MILIQLLLIYTINIDLGFPSRSTFGFSHIFSQRGLISLDYEITKYNNAMFTDNEDNYLNELNYIIDNELYAMLNQYD